MTLLALNLICLFSNINRKVKIQYGQVPVCFLLKYDNTLPFLVLVKIPKLGWQYSSIPNFWPVMLAGPGLRNS